MNRYYRYLQIACIAIDLFIIIYLRDHKYA